MFSDTPAINIGPQKEGSTVASLTLGMPKAQKMLDQEEAERKTGDNQDD